MPSPHLIHRLSLMVLMAALFASPSLADDWPQILGPSRNGVSGEKLPNRFPTAGPKVVWSAPVGQGYAGPAVAQGKVVLFHRIDGQERVEAFDVNSGKSLWTADFPALYRGGIDPDTGPRCVPLIHNDRVYVYGAANDCYCVALKTGETIWSRALAEDFEATESYFGAGSTPILIGERLLINLGAKRAGIIGLNAATGKTEWSTTTEAASYSSPALMKRGPQEHAVFLTRMNVVAIDPLTGTAETLFPFGKTGPTVNAATPLIDKGLLFVTSSYGVGAKCTSLPGKTSPEVLWSNDSSLSSQYATPVIREGYVYGIHGREDIPPAHLRCIELKSGKVMWTSDGFGVAHAILAGDKLLLMTIDGQVVLAEASPKAYRELGRATISKSATRAMPALSDGQLFCRSKEKLLCVQVGE